MKANGFSHIRKWLWIFLLLVILTVVAVFLVIYHQINTFGLIWLSKSEVAGSAAHWTAFKIRLLLLLSAGAIIIFVMGFLWLRIAWRRLNRPVRMIDRAVSRLAAGKLNVTVTIESADEFGKIGAGLNELAANLQELLLFIWKQSGQCITILQKMDSHIDLDSARDLPSYDPVLFKQIFESIRDLRQMAETYVFYDVRLEGEQALAINEPGQTQSILDTSE